MNVTIPLLRAAGLTESQILRVVELVDSERTATRREQNRIAQRNQRARHQFSADSADTPSPPPLKENTPHTPLKENNPSSPPPSSLRSDSCDDAFARRTSEQAFEEFWREYPKRDGANPRAPAKAKFVAILRSGVPFEAVMSGLRRDRKQLEGKNQVGTVFVPMAQTWLNQKRWDVGEQGNLPLLSVVSTGPTAYDLELIEAYKRRQNGGATNG